MPEVAISVSHVSKSFRSGGVFSSARPVEVLRNLSLDVMRGEVLGVVGESGCGKSTLTKVMLGLEEPTCGDVHVRGVSMDNCGRSELARFVQPVFQDPYSSLNPRCTVAEIIGRPLSVHRIGTKAERSRNVETVMAKVGLPARFAASYPSQLSGGQRQRVAIARALILRPEVVICDEPTSALDVSVQSQILNLLMDLRDDFNLTLVFVSHNLAVVEHLATRIAVMYLGEVVEIGDTSEVFDRPQHPYTKLLLGSVLLPSKLGGLSDSVGHAKLDPTVGQDGCLFAPRCRDIMPICTRDRPRLVRHGASQYACHAAEQGRTT